MKTEKWAGYTASYNRRGNMALIEVAKWAVVVTGRRPVAMKLPPREGGGEPSARYRNPRDYLPAARREASDASVTDALCSSAASA